MEDKTIADKTLADAKAADADFAAAKALQDAYAVKTGAVVEAQKAVDAIAIADKLYPSGQLTFRTPALRTMVSAYF